MAAVLPQSFRGGETFANFRSADPAFGCYVSPSKRIELWKFMNVSEHDPDNPVSVGAGDAEFAELNSSECVALFMDTSNDAHGHLWYLPSGLDVSGDLKFRVAFTNSEGAGTGSIQFVVKYTALTAGTTAVAVGGTALSTAIADKTDLAANVLTWSDWGVLDGGTISNAAGEDALVLKTYVTLTTCADASALMLQAEYRRRFI